MRTGTASAPATPGCRPHRRRTLSPLNAVAMLCRRVACGRSGLGVCGCCYRCFRGSCRVPCSCSVLFLFFLSRRDAEKRRGEGGRDGEPRDRESATILYVDTLDCHEQSCRCDTIHFKFKPLVWGKQVKVSEVVVQNRGSKCIQLLYPPHGYA